MKNVIKADRLSYINIEHNEVFSNLSIMLNKEDSLCIIGKNGSGKTPLLKMLCGIIPPTSGNITIFGKNPLNISRSKLMELRKNIGYIFQDSALISNLTVRENIALPLKYWNYNKSVYKTTDELITKLNLSEYIHKTPAFISIGIKKLVALARATIMEQSVIFMDEPLLGLDRHMVEIFVDYINNIKREREMSMIAASCDEYLAKKLDMQIIEL